MSEYVNQIILIFISQQGEVVTGSADSALMGSGSLQGCSITSHLDQWNTFYPHYWSSGQHLTQWLFHMANLVMLLFALFLECLHTWRTAHSFRTGLISFIPCENNEVPIHCCTSHYYTSSFLCHVTFESWRISVKRSYHMCPGSPGVPSARLSFPMCVLVAWGKKEICKAWFSLYLCSCLLTYISCNLNQFFWYKF